MQGPIVNQSPWLGSYHDLPSPSRKRPTGKGESDQKRKDEATTINIVFVEVLATTSCQLASGIASKSGCGVDKLSGELCVPFDSTKDDESDILHISDTFFIVGYVKADFTGYSEFALKSDLQIIGGKSLDGAVLRGNASDDSKIVKGRECQSMGDVGPGDPIDVQMYESNLGELTKYVVTINFRFEIAKNKRACPDNGGGSCKRGILVFDFIFFRLGKCTNLHVCRIERSPGDAEVGVIEKVRDKEHGKSLQGRGDENLFRDYNPIVRGRYLKTWLE
ncbi:hypothetical protein V1477_008796 [Vespula maculifrons]|uniref:Uncharacterized protein n=1 Tax=Vespula maculifrons TaxID=7453 RepID=A0ABD2CE21_VESMC